MPDETIGDVEHVVTADHPPRTNSLEYTHTREWLMTTPGGCYVCGGPIDMSHPSITKDIQDHHGGGIFLVQDGQYILVGWNLFGMEWSLGWAALPSKVQAYVTQINEVATRLGGQAYTAEIATTVDVMNYVDSPANANVKLCAVHHIAHENADSKDVNGHQGVGIHNGPFPIWLGQVTCDWSQWDMWGGTTGTVAVVPSDGGKATAIYVSPLHTDQALRSEFIAKGSVELATDHSYTRAAYRLN